MRRRKLVLERALCPEQSRRSQKEDLSLRAITATVIKELYIRKLKPDELEDAAHLLGRGMCDNPNNVRAFGPDRMHRERVLARMFLRVLRRTHAKGNVFGTFARGKMVGVYAIAAPGQCQPNGYEKLHILPAIVLGTPPSTSLRFLRWVGEWARRDLAELHWHLGPVAVDSHLQGQGIGGTMLVDFCARMDERGALSYLETDKRENVRFYEKFGFAVIAECNILGVPNWFMSRPNQNRSARAVTLDTGIS